MCRLCVTIGSADCVTMAMMRLSAVRKSWLSLYGLTVVFHRSRGGWRSGKQQKASGNLCPPTPFACPTLLGLRQQLLDHLGFAEQAHGSAGGAHQLVMGVQPQALEEGGGDVVRRAGLVGGGHAGGAGGAVGVSGFDA